LRENSKITIEKKQKTTWLDYAFLNSLEKYNFLYEIPAVSNKKLKDLEIQDHEHEHEHEHEHDSTSPGSQVIMPKN